MGLALWRKNYLTGDKHLYSPVSVPYLAWATACRNDFHMYNGSSDVRTYFFFYPICWMRHLIYRNPVWLGILCISVLGPVLEELLSVVPLPRTASQI